MTKPILPVVLKLWIPELDRHIICKVDTGADNSSLHIGSAAGLAIDKVVRIKGRLQPVPQTHLTLFGKKHPVNLSDRSQMRCEMIIGRSAIRGSLVDPDWQDKETVYGT